MYVCVSVCSYSYGWWHPPFILPRGTLRMKDFEPPIALCFRAYVCIQVSISNFLSFSVCMPAERRHHHHRRYKFSWDARSVSCSFLPRVFCHVFVSVSRYMRALFLSIQRLLLLFLILTFPLSISAWSALSLARAASTRILRWAHGHHRTRMFVVSQSYTFFLTAPICCTPLFQVPLPDLRGRQLILKAHARKMPIDSGMICAACFTLSFMHAYWYTVILWFFFIFVDFILYSSDHPSLSHGVCVWTCRREPDEDCARHSRFQWGWAGESCKPGLAQGLSWPWGCHHADYAWVGQGQDSYG